MKLTNYPGDTFLTQGMRQKLIALLRQKGIEDKQVLEAMLQVPRHLFFPDQAFVEKAYADMAFQIGAGQTISQPYTVARQTELLQVRKGMKVLEIGTGSGYQAAVLIALGAKVFSVERQHILFVKTQALLNRLHMNAYLSYGDGFLGLPGYAPFDRIIVTAGAPHLPQALVEQLLPGGLMVIPIGAEGKQIMYRYTKMQDGNLSEESFGDFSFVPLLEKRV